MNKKTSRIVFILFCISAVLFLKFLSRENYLLFHSIVEIFTVIIAFSIFIVVWNTRNLTDNSFLSLLGIAYLSAGLFSLSHCLAYNGMGVFAGDSSNSSLQFWVAGRLFACMGVFSSIFLLKKRIRIGPIALLYSVFFVVVYLSIYPLRFFPDCYVEKSGLTLFKTGSEYVFLIIQAISVFLLIVNRKTLDSQVVFLLISSIILSVAGELSFTFQTDTSSYKNFIGHIFELASFYLIYRAFLVIGLSKPFDSVFRNLKLHEKELKRSRYELEQRVYERTKELGIINADLQNEIEERKRKEIALQKSEERFRVVLKNSKISVAHCDLNLRYTWVHSPYFFSDNQNIIGLTDEEISTDPGYKKLMEIKRSVVLSGNGKRVEIAFRKDSHRIIHDVTAEPLFDDNGKIMGVTTASVDITEKREVEEALKVRHRALEAIYMIAINSGSNRESIYEQIVETISIILNVPYVSIGQVYDNTMNTIAHFSKTGATHEHLFTMQDTPCEKITSEKMPLQCINNLNKEFPKNRCVKNGEFKSYFGVPIFNNKSAVAGMICMLDNRTRRYTSEEIHLIEIFSRYVAQEFEREQFHKEMLQSNEMKILGQLTSGVAHEVRNPLNAICAITEALFQELENNGEISIYKEHIRGQVDRLSRLMQDLLDFGKPFDLEGCSAISLTSLCNSVIDLWKQTNDKSGVVILFNCRIQNDPAMIKADPTKLQQMIINLLDNAAQHSEQEKEITVDLKKGGDGYYNIKIIDKGKGIPPENIKRMFEPFFTTRKKGTGLGLCIVKHIVETHRGVITIVNNTPLPGITVEIRLPIFDSSSGSTPSPGVKEVTKEVVSG